MAQKLIAPSRGLMRQFILRGTIPQAFFVRGHCRYYSRAASKFVEEATNPDNKTQIYISRTQNPFINLSIEHYLLQKTPADSTILFLYTNENSIVMGRNQNVWNEVNLHAVQHADEKISLVRRRSGGGTVFHDAGNVNYCVIFPTSKFDRDRHAEMIVRALHKLGVTTAMVNARHDIVLQKTRPNTPKTRKVSGSAYKVTRERSLHHGTCLLSSPNLRSITDYLRSPAKRFIKSRGVESVGSTISNAKVKSNKAFEDAVVKEFNEMYDKREPIILTEAVKEVPEIVKGIEELTSPDWIFSQTPQFTFTTEDTKKVRKQKPLPAYLPPEFKASFTARNGIILEAEIEYRDEKKELQKFGKEMVDKKIHEIEWNELIPNIAREPLKFLGRLFSNKRVQ